MRYPRPTLLAAASIAAFLGAAVVLAQPAAAADPLPAASGRALAMSRPQWRLWVPADYQPRPDGAVDLLVHLHGDPQTVWNNAAAARLNAVVVTANYNGLSRAYAAPFADPRLFQTLLDDALARLKTDPRFGDAAHWDHVVVASFSAGYGAVREILKQPHYRDAIAGLLAVDSLYASTAAGGAPEPAQMADYLTYAKRAVAGEKTFIFTHTEVPTPTYESTRDTGEALLRGLGLEAHATNQPGLGPLVFVRRAGEGGFAFWGSPGDTGEDHMNHLRYMAEWLDDLPLDRHAQRRSGAAPN
ncbi:hypothetical protein Pla175_50320 [Pirellulimonas nuda]|uniref:Alpha/beta hydrolase family protein n=1 Tax=Pirellulimonas nuda TaxID=2528009 RepID=A0A518DJI4_9BACT|nr:hypothetical protein [Pirellulimonas nuda]QDU91602.1 hypothetical protein Pla175_50320 [Pirellulimonas nuda]